mgnify:CR=1 FL=1
MILKNFKKLLNLIITENIFKYTTEKYKEHIKKFPNIVHPAFDVIGPHISLFGRFEHNELKVLEERVFNKIDCSNSTCLDIGANIGNHSVFFANFFSSVDCFEPQPDNYYLLKFNSKNFSNIKTFNFGASDVDENQYMYIATDTTMSRNTLFSDRVEPKKIEQIHPKKIKVELKNLDNLLKENKVKKISFIKIDIEGYEYKALIGLKNTIINDSPIIVLEQWTDAFDEIKKTTKSIDFLKKNHYKFFYEPNYFRRKKNKNKILRSINKIIFFLQILFDSKKINLCDLKKIENFEIRPYPIIIASKINLVD